MNESPTPVPSLKRPRQFNLVHLVLAAGLSGVLVVGSVKVPLPLVTVHPGPAPSASGLIKIEAATFTSSGSFHVTTVTVFDATLLDAIWGWLSPDISVLPRSAVYPPDLTEEEVDEENATEMDASKVAATVAALRELGYPLEPDGALIRATAAGMPAAGKLRAGDVIVAVDGLPVLSLEEARVRIEARRIGERVRVSVRRDGALQEFALEVAASGDRPERPVIGVELEPSYKLPFAIVIDSQGIGGPSAGLTFALSIVDLLDPEDLTGGRKIADTGTIDFEGKVGPVGGVAQKVKAAERIGAQVFVVPKRQYEEATRAAGGRMSVIGVSTLREALEILRRRAA